MGTKDLPKLTAFSRNRSGILVRIGDVVREGGDFFYIRLDALPINGEIYLRHTGDSAPVGCPKCGCLDALCAQCSADLPEPVQR